MKVWNTTLTKGRRSLVSFAAFALLLGSLASFGADAVPEREQAVPDAATRKRIAAGYGKLPLAFEENLGQTDSRVKYFSRGNDYRLFLTSDKAVLSLDKPRKHQATDLPSGLADGSGELGMRADTMEAPAVVSMEVVGANPDSAVSARDELPGKSNYFIGNDRSRWRTDVSRYERVRYEEVYPGIDLVYHGQRGRLEYDFVVTPGADPSPIRLRFGGSDAISLEPDGSLQLTTEGVSVRQKKPFLYQERGHGQVEIAGNFVRLSDNEVGFEIGSYHRTRELVIDPEIIYSTYLGGGTTDLGRAIAVDTQKNAYLVGTTASLPFPGGAIGSALDPAKGFPPGEITGISDAYIVKLDPSGTKVLYSAYLGGDEMGQLIDTADSVQVDAAGNAYFVGLGTLGFPITSGSMSDLAGFDEESYVLAKINPAGNGLVFSTRIMQNVGGIFSPNVTSGFVFDIALDAEANTYFTGARLAAMGTQIWVGKINSTGTALLEGIVIGPAGEDSGGVGISVDTERNIYVAGRTDQDLPTTQFAFQGLRNGGATDAFVAKLNSDFELLFLTYLGGSQDDDGRSVATNAAGNVYVTGFTGLSSFIGSTKDGSRSKGITTGFTPFPTTASGFDQQCCGESRADGYLAVLSPDGSQLLYGTLIGGDDFTNVGEAGSDVAVDANGFAHITGTAATSDFPVTADAFQPMFGGAIDGFYMIIDPAAAGLKALRYSSFLGGESTDLGFGLALDTAANACVTGITASREFPTTPDSLQPTSVDMSSEVFFDAFVTKIGQPCLITSADPLNINFGVVPPLVRSVAIPVRLTLAEPVTDFQAVLSDQLNFEVATTPRFVSDREVEFDVFFLPRQEGTFNATLELFATTEQSRTECHQTITLRGQTLTIGADPSRIDFTPQEISCGQSSGPRVLSVFNETESRLVLNVAWRDRSALSVEPNGIVALGPAGSGTDVARFDVTYLEPSEVPFNDIITFTADGTLVLEVPVTAPACGALLTIDPLVLAFGSVPVDGAVTLPVTISTARPTALPVTVEVPEGQPFSVSQSSFDVSSSAPVVIDVTFQPGAVGFFDTALGFNAEGGAVELPVSGLASFGSIQITGVEVSVDPTPDPAPTVGVQFNGAPTENLRGRLEFDFAPDNLDFPPDPLLAFLDTGTNSVDFRLPVGSTQAEFLVNGTPMQTAYQPGTLAGTITFRLSQLTTEDGGEPVDFGGASVASTRVEPAAPVIQETTCSRSGTTLTIVARGLSTTREITGVNLNLTAASGANLTFTPPSADFANAAISEWYGSEASTASGSTIALTVPLQIQGAFNALGQATISFSNSEGTSNTGQVSVSACQ